MSVKDRVKSVINYKKPAFWIVVVAVIVCAGVGVCFGSSPMLEWSGKTVPYQIAAQDDVNHTVDILYYVWTSDPHVSVWRERITLTWKGKISSIPDDGEYIVSGEKLTFLDNISNAKEFQAAYPFYESHGKMKIVLL